MWSASRCRPQWRSRYSGRGRSPDPSGVFGDRLAKRPSALIFGVGVGLPGFDGIDRRLPRVVRRREVGLAEPRLIASSPAASNTSRIPLMEIRSTLSEKFGIPVRGRCRELVLVTSRPLPDRSPLVAAGRLSDPPVLVDREREPPAEHAEHLFWRRAEQRVVDRPEPGCGRPSPAGILIASIRPRRARARRSSVRSCPAAIPTPSALPVCSVADPPPQVPQQVIVARRQRDEERRSVTSPVRPTAPYGGASSTAATSSANLSSSVSQAAASRRLRAGISTVSGVAAANRSRTARPAGVTRFGASSVTSVRSFSGPTTASIRSGDANRIRWTSGSSATVRSSIAPSATASATAVPRTNARPSASATPGRQATRHVPPLVRSLAASIGEKRKWDADGDDRGPTGKRRFDRVG